MIQFNFSSTGADELYIPIDINGKREHFINVTGRNSYLMQANTPGTYSYTLYGRNKSGEYNVAYRTIVVSGYNLYSKIQQFMNDSRWKIGTLFNNDVKAKLANEGAGTGWGCNGYARDFTWYVYKKELRSGVKYNDTSQIKVGDTLYFYDAGKPHWSVVIARNGNSIEVIHGNWTNGKVCKTGSVINGNKILNKTFQYGYHY